jgi:hypothetical protein
MKKSIVILFMILWIKLSAQSDFRSGYIINGNDTTYGLIDYRGGKMNQEECLFRKDINSVTIRYLPSQLTAFRFIDSKFYLSKSIKINKMYKQIFLECLIKGKVTVYYAWLDGQDLYFVEKDTCLREINNDEKLNVDEYGDKYLFRTNQYKGMLKAFFSDCPEVFNKVNNVELDKKSLIKISKDYHERVCKDEKCIVYEKDMTTEHLFYGINYSYNIIPGNLREYRYIRMAGFTIQANLPQFNEKDYCSVTFKFGLMSDNTKFLNVNILYMRKFGSGKIHPFAAVGGSFISFLPFFSCQTGIDIPVGKDFIALGINYDGWFKKDISIFGLSASFYF